MYFFLCCSIKFVNTICVERVSSDGFEDGISKLDAIVY